MIAKFPCRLTANPVVKLGQFISHTFSKQFTYEREMSNKRYVDAFAEPMLTALDKAKDELVEKLKNKLMEELDINEKMKENQVKLEEQMKIEVGKNATLRQRSVRWRKDWRSRKKSSKC